MSVIVVMVIVSMLMRVGDFLMSMFVAVSLRETLGLETYGVRMPMMNIVVGMGMRVRHFLMCMRMGMFRHN